MRVCENSPLGCYRELLSNIDAYQRNNTGEVRVAWKVILITLLFLAEEAPLRFIPISLLTAYLSRGGLTKMNALERATTTVYQDSVYSTLIGILTGFMGLLIVWLLERGLKSLASPLKQ